MDKCGGHEAGDHEARDEPHVLPNDPPEGFAQFHESRSVAVIGWHSPGSAKG